jgi:hypothetical protein
VAQGTAHGSAVPDLKVTDVRDRGSDQAWHARVVLDVALSCHGPDAHSPLRDRYLLQFGNPMQVNDVARPGKPHRKHWNQTLATGEGPRLVPVLGHDPQRLLKHFWPVVLERRRFQSRDPPLVMTVLRWILPQSGHERHAVAEYLVVVECFAGRLLSTHVSLDGAGEAGSPIARRSGENGHRRLSSLPNPSTWLAPSGNCYHSERWLPAPLSPSKGGRHPPMHHHLTPAGQMRDEVP